MTVPEARRPLTCHMLPSRYQRMARNKVLMVGGTDEHQASETFRYACASGDDAHQARARWHHYQAQLRAAAA